MTISKVSRQSAVLASCLGWFLLVAGVVIEPDLPQRSINFDPSEFIRGSFEISPDDPLIKDLRTDFSTPEQVSVIRG